MTTSFTCDRRSSNLRRTMITLCLFAPTPRPVAWRQDEPYGKGVRELVQGLGGTVEFDSQVGSGTCVVVEIPMLREDGQAGSLAGDWEWL